MKPTVCLGTAQFGLDYGITNRMGKVTEETAHQILNEAQKYGFNTLDTAAAYGDAEKIIGKIIMYNNDFKLISKLPRQEETSFKESSTSIWDRTLARSLERLKTDSLEGLLVHSSEDLKKEGNEYLIDWLRRTKDYGYTKKVGVTIYEKDELEGIDLKNIDIVQLPLSLYDQRMVIEGTIAKLKDRGIEVHARSIYMQGLILQKSIYWPKWVGKNSENMHKKLESFARQKNLDLLDMAIGYVKDQEGVDKIVIGVCNTRELRDLQKKWKEENCKYIIKEWEGWKLEETEILDPRKWPKG